MKVTIRKARPARKHQKSWMMETVWPATDVINLPYFVRDERDLVQYLQENYGDGQYSILIHKRGIKSFRSLFKGTIEQERWIRQSGQLSKYLVAIKPVNVWHRIET